MPSKIFFLRDERDHDVSAGHERELCALDLPRGGSFLALAKGQLLATRLTFSVELTVFRFGGGILSKDHIHFDAHQDEVQVRDFILCTAAEVPHEGGAGTGTPPPEPRVGLSVNLIGGGVGGNGFVQNVTMFAVLLDDIVATTIPRPPDPPE